MKFLFNLFILYIAAEVGNVEGAYKYMGPVGNIIINSVYECPENERPTNDDVVVKIDLNDKDGKKSLSVAYTSKIPIDDDISFLIVLKKWDNGGWKKVYDVKGQVCAEIKKYVPKMLAKVRAAIKPNPGLECPIKEGTYSLDDFTMLSKELEFPSIFYGKLLAKMTSTDKTGKLLLCRIVEVDSQA